MIKTLIILVAILISPFQNNDPSLSIQNSSIEIQMSAASPTPVTVINGGKELTLSVSGDEYGYFTKESATGYIIKQNQNNEFKYVVYDESTLSYTLSNTTASDSRTSIDQTQQRASTQENSLNYIKAEDIESISLSNREFIYNRPKPTESINNSSQLLSSSLNASSTTLENMPSTGDLNVLCLLIEYPDLPHTISRDEIDSLFNSDGYRSNHSFTEFYRESSGGKCNFNVTVSDWIMADHEYQYYSSSTRNTHALITEAATAADENGEDLANYDNDNNGDIDAVIVLHAGPGAEETGEIQYIWSHKHSLMYTDSDITIDNKTLNNYIAVPELSSNRNALTGIGIICHEFGHCLGLIDLYSTNSTNSGIGHWGLMGYGSWLDSGYNPSDFTSFSKMLLGWISPIRIEAEDDNYTLSPYSTTHKVLKLPISEDESEISEFFLIENRQKIGLDIALPANGLAIWHVDLAAYSDGENVTSHKLIDMEEANGAVQSLDQLSYIGGAGDLYPLLKPEYSQSTSDNREFTDQSTPNSLSYSGVAPEFSIKEITISGSDIVFQIVENVENIEISASTLNSGGTISPQLISDVESDQEYNFVIETEIDKYIDSVTLNGVDITDMVNEINKDIEESREYELNITNIEIDSEIVVVFKDGSHLITQDIDGEGILILLDADVSVGVGNEISIPDGDTFTIKTEPESGYFTKSITINSNLVVENTTSEESITSFEITATEDLHIEVLFEVISHLITQKIDGKGVSLLVGGDVSVENNLSIPYGDIVSINTEPESDYFTKSITVNNNLVVENTELKGSITSFETIVTEDLYVEVLFEPISLEFNIFPTIVSQGSISIVKPEYQNSYTVMIYNTSGREVFQETYSENCQIETQSFANGIYFIVIESTSIRRNSKIIIAQ